MIRTTLLRAAFVAALLSSFAFAEVTGIVTNATTGKPAAGDEVVLLNMGESMAEVARATTDAKGRFTFKETKNDAPYIVRVKHGKVDYHRPVMPGAGTVEVQVYDAAAQVEGITPTVRMMRIYAEGENLFITDLYAVRNTSAPPKTKMSERSFEFVAPEGAELLGGFALGAGQTTWLKSAPVPTDQPNRYAMIYPLRPGETRFQIEYRMPYNGKAQLQVQLLSNVEHMLVMVPTSMQFQGEGVTWEKAEEQGAMMHVTGQVKAGQNLAFTITGTGTFPPEGQQPQGGGEAQQGPGGGIGKPIGKPDPLAKYRWWILGGVGLAMVIGAALVLSRKPAELPSATAVDVTRPTGLTKAAAANSDRATVLLDTLKEELFALESDRLQGKITEAEYSTQKSALEQTLRRAMSRNNG